VGHRVHEIILGVRTENSSSACYKNSPTRPRKATLCNVVIRGVPPAVTGVLLGQVRGDFLVAHWVGGSVFCGQEQGGRAAPCRGRRRRLSAHVRVCNSYGFAVARRKGLVEWNGFSWTFLQSSVISTVLVIGDECAMLWPSLVEEAKCSNRSDKVLIGEQQFQQNW
jgi:hypothetical protein